MKEYTKVALRLQMQTVIALFLAVFLFFQTVIVFLLVGNPFASTIDRGDWVQRMNYTSIEGEQALGSYYQIKGTSEQEWLYLGNRRRGFMGMGSNNPPRILQHRQSTACPIRDSEVDRIYVVEHQVAYARYEAVEYHHDQIIRERQLIDEIMHNLRTIPAVLDPCQELFVTKYDVLFRFADMPGLAWKGALCFDAQGETFLQVVDDDHENQLIYYSLGNGFGQYDPRNRP